MRWVSALVFALVFFSLNNGVLGECIVPYAGMIINESTVFCKGEYNLSGSGLNIIVNSDNIYIDCNGSELIAYGDHWKTGFDLGDRKNVFIKNCIMNNYNRSVNLGFSNHNKFENFSINNSGMGFAIYISDNNVFSQNTIYSSYFGIYLSSADSNVIVNNTFLENDYGVALTGHRMFGNCFNNFIYNNKFYESHLMAGASSQDSYNNNVFCIKKIDLDGKQISYDNKYYNNSFGPTCFDNTEDINNLEDRLSDIYNIIPQIESNISSIHFYIEQDLYNNPYYVYLYDGFFNGSVLDTQKWTESTDSAGYPDIHEIEDLGLWGSFYIIQEEEGISEHKLTMKRKINEDERLRYRLTYNEGTGNNLHRIFINGEGIQNLIGCSNCGTIGYWNSVGSFGNEFGDYEIEYFFTNWEIYATIILPNGSEIFERFNTSHLEKPYEIQFATGTGNDGTMNFEISDVRIIMQSCDCFTSQKDIIDIKERVTVMESLIITVKEATCFLFDVLNLNNPFWQCGVPEEPVCSQDSDCGGNGFIGSEYCLDRDVYQDYRNFTCNNPGEQTASCSHLVTPQMTEGCDFGCENAQCLSEPPPSEDVVIFRAEDLGFGRADWIAYDTDGNGEMEGWDGSGLELVRKPCPCDLEADMGEKHLCIYVDEERPFVKFSETSGFCYYREYRPYEGAETSSEPIEDYTITDREVLESQQIG